MKKNKMTRLASLLLVCVMLCSMLAMVASAAGTSCESYILTVTSSAANVRRKPSANSEVIGNLMRGDEFKTDSDLGSTWYYGLPGPETKYFKEFEYTFGYVNYINFV